jgi:very-short-patch-repair endonuclease
MGTSEGARKGHTPESDAKRAETMRQKFLDPAYRAAHAEKIRAARARMGAEQRSEAAKKSHTPESDTLRRESMQRKWDDPGYRERREALEATPEMQAARSAAMRVANVSPEKRRAHSEYMKNRHASDADYQRMRQEWLRRAGQDPLVKEARSQKMKQAWHDQPELFKNSIEAILRVTRTPEFREAKRAALARLWEEGKLKAPILGRGKSPTSLELIVAAELVKHGIVYLTRFSVGRYELDLFVPEFNLDIEADGEYWHSEEHFPGRPAHDAKRDAALRGMGYKVLRLPEVDIKNGSFITALTEALK